MENKTEMVSVIIPMYNRETTIRRAAESVLDQTYCNLELIIVDDCSTDNSVTEAKNIQDDRVRVITCEKNGGACQARNIGIEYANGDYIAFQDSDDFWHKDKLEKSLYYLEKEKVDLVFSALVREEKKNGVLEKSVLPSYDFNLETNKISRVMQQNCVSTQTIVAKRSVFDKVRFDVKFPRFQDWDFIIQALLKGINVYYINEPLVDCYVLENSITGDGKKAIRALRLMEMKYADEYEKRRDAYEGFCARAGYLVEMAGGNGCYYFKKEYKIKKSISKLIKVILSKLRLYKLLNKMVAFLKKSR